MRLFRRLRRVGADPAEPSRTRRRECAMRGGGGGRRAMRRRDTRVRQDVRSSDVSVIESDRVRPVSVRSSERRGSARARTAVGNRRAPATPPRRRGRRQLGRGRAPVRFVAVERRVDAAERVRRVHCVRAHVL